MTGGNEENVDTNAVSNEGKHELKIAARGKADQELIKRHHSFKGILPFSRPRYIADAPSIRPQSPFALTGKTFQELDQRFKTLHSDIINTVERLNATRQSPQAGIAAGREIPHALAEIRQVYVDLQRDLGRNYYAYFSNKVAARIQQAHEKVNQIFKNIREFTDLDNVDPPLNDEEKKTRAELEEKVDSYIEDMFGTNGAFEKRHTSISPKPTSNSEADKATAKRKESEHILCYGALLTQGVPIENDEDPDTWSKQITDAYKNQKIDKTVTLADGIELRIQVDEKTMTLSTPGMGAEWSESALEDVFQEALRLYLSKAPGSVIHIELNSGENASANTKANNRKLLQKLYDAGVPVSFGEGLTLRLADGTVVQGSKDKDKTYQHPTMSLTKHQTDGKTLFQDCNVAAQGCIDALKRAEGYLSHEGHTKDDAQYKLCMDDAERAYRQYDELRDFAEKFANERKDTKLIDQLKDVQRGVETSNPEGFKEIAERVKGPQIAEGQPADTHTQPRIR